MPSRPRSPAESTVIVANGVGSSAPSLITRIEPSCWVTKIRPSGACANAVERREAGDPGLVAGEAARLRHAAAELNQRRRPGGDVARGVARPRPQHVLAAGVEAGVEGDGIRRGGVDGAEGHAVDLELDAGHGDVVAGRGGDRDHADQAGERSAGAVSVAVGTGPAGGGLPTEPSPPPPQATSTTRTRTGRLRSDRQVERFMCGAARRGAVQPKGLIMANLGPAAIGVTAESRRRRPRSAVPPRERLRAR